MTNPAETPAAPKPRAIVEQLPRYSQSAAAGVVRWRASSNESPFPPSPEVVAAVSEAAARANRYPSLFGDLLAVDIAERLGVSRAQVVTGGGSISLLQQTLLSYVEPGQEVVIPWRSYEAYPILIGVAGAKQVRVPLAADHTHDLEAMLAAITPDTAAVVVCTPNNPTGTEVAADRLADFLDRVPPTVLVLLDEAYCEFGDAARSIDVPALLQRHANLAVFRTFSKAYGLAGVRAGYMISSEEIAENVRTASPPFGLSLTSEAAARAAWADTAHLDATVTAVRASRARLREALVGLGYDVPVSGANFVWVPAPDTLALEAACADEGVSVRAFPGEGVRITVGEQGAEKAVLRALGTLR
ncbi:MAG: histidinol-phosphate transaminase [Leucobacter sp.]